MKVQWLISMMEHKQPLKIMVLKLTESHGKMFHSRTLSKNKQNKNLKTICTKLLQYYKKLIFKCLMVTLRYF